MSGDRETRTRTGGRSGPLLLALLVAALAAASLGATGSAAGSTGADRHPVAATSTDVTPVTTTPSATAPTPAAPTPAAPGRATAPGTAPEPPPAGPPSPVPTGPLPAPADPSAPPEPHIISQFAGALSGPKRELPGRSVASVPVRADIDGCNRDYGSAGQCIPNRLPPGERDLCSYLAKQRFPPVKVRGVDRSRVDLNRNGVICD